MWLALIILIVVLMIHMYRLTESKYKKDIYGMMYSGFMSVIFMLIIIIVRISLK